MVMNVGILARVLGGNVTGCEAYKSSPAESEVPLVGGYASWFSSLYLSSGWAGCCLVVVDAMMSGRIC